MNKNINNKNFKIPRLTTEEVNFFLKEEDFYNKKLRYKYNLWLPLYRRVGMALQSLAVAKLIGGYKGIEKVNKKDAIDHHIKACLCYPETALNHSEFRKGTVLSVINLLLKYRIGP